MATITNVSSVADNSGETPIITPSNPVTTVVNETPPECECSCCYCYYCRCRCCGRCYRCCYRCCCCRDDYCE